ncbi:MAG TPA: hypothetical protein VN603_07875, partial [Candidatus Acidoferrales bacterium]|nr:hypothetical protein [Candidatus Acidoferrales bacterium]
CIVDQRSNQPGFGLAYTTGASVTSMWLGVQWRETAASSLMFKCSTISFFPSCPLDKQVDGRRIERARPQGTTGFVLLFLS